LIKHPRKVASESEERVASKGGAKGGLGDAERRDVTVLWDWQMHSQCSISIMLSWYHGLVTVCSKFYHTGKFENLVAKVSQELVLSQRVVLDCKPSNFAVIFLV
jgi:hypothetical protein